MTGFAAARGAHEGYSWVWELRSVNGKGLDLRVRAPDWIEGLEAGLRARLTKALARGNVSVGLRIQAEEQGGRLRVNAAQLDDVLAAMAEVEARAMAQGLSLAPARPGDVLSVRGVLETASADQDSSALSKVLLADFDPVLDAFQQMRATEGKALHGILTEQLDEVARLTDEAVIAAEERRDEVASALRASLARVMDNTDGVDEARLTQELALIAVKSDVTEEIDRLRTHVTAARDLLTQDGAVGRKLDFLMQEFNREANTLCSKAQSGSLTTIGLALKAVIDQMREQVQNVE
ncbi:YicC family protein [Pseudohalocynthiibacter aestuariivivens]|nr:YicC/YloC family endoribonuclease [Pseudohalocynthiibacter aestuariivivens]QIE47398.1 YicC family protein [Pseudohalocynthiibacter aestuariivivens]